jgi:hypothetical protein
MVNSSPPARSANRISRVLTAAQALTALCEAHGIDREVQVLEDWLAARAT